MSALEITVDEKNNHIASIQEETRGLKAEMEVVNKVPTIAFHLLYKLTVNVIEI